MAPSSVAKKRKVLDGMQGKTNRPNKKFRKQRGYHSSDEEDNDDETAFKGVSLADSDAEDNVKARPPQKKTKASGQNQKPKVAEVEQKEAEESNADSDGGDDASDNSEGEDGEGASKGRNVQKRNDPSAFSTSISKILSTKLPTSARADPVLSRSKSASQTTTDFADEKIDRQARAKLRAEKKEELDRGRIRDIKGIERGQAGPVAEEEKRLRKIGQRGVVKLFNAVRAAQVRGEEAAKQERKRGTVGIGEREKAANEVSRQGFLDLISGKKGKPLNIEEA
ncbi:rRNA-processing protein RRP15 [Aspergillus ruber CBS 135680]|uniref:Rrp15p-domain-containing protein n=1 Tax=Aspergillus ruber (strain CBS 135680) TaxID=1388766 RepID=A0A017SFT8_ASPRC|nr:Rrp15p-domain-containing protein [Aspergillus ruber CBS 135680]EYE95832.1 Rrp15p-domain-containing protein [Aspergillus ruber CBS 135680]